MALALKALFTAWIVGTIIAPMIIPILHRLKFGQHVRNDGPSGHFAKAGTPTMGGIIFLTAMVVAVLLWSSWSYEALVAVGIVLGFGFLGFLDDFIKVALKRPLGLRGKQKIFGQLVLSLILIYAAVQVMGRGTDLIVPVLGLKWDLGEWYYLLAMVLVVATTNAVNLTDGLDGLAAGTTFLVYLGYLFIALLAINNPPVHIIDYADIAVFTGALAGGCLAFLLFNRYPAKIFMGDTGSLALGGGIAVLAIFTKTELVLPVLGGVYVIETLSVIIQVVSFRLTGKRIFRMSPLHHHFELLGWHEKKVVYSFWAMSALAVSLGLVLITL